MRTLSIGNSFSQDATRWLHDLAESVGFPLTCVNLYIGGCSLEQHWNNAETGAAAYAYEENGLDTGRKVSIAEALEEGDWNVVTLQQVSGKSGQYETYQPYLNKLAAFVREKAPLARLMIHQTWAYEIGSTHADFARYGNSQLAMYNALCEVYEQAADAIEAETIPCGDIIQVLRTKAPFDVRHGGLSLCRDGFHLSYTYGRYAAAAVWLSVLSGEEVSPCEFIPQVPGEPVDPALLELIRTTVDEILQS